MQDNRCGRHGTTITHGVHGAMKSPAICGLEAGDPVQVSEKVANSQNKLQIRHPSRFIFPRKGEFDLAENAIKQNPTPRRGLGLTGG
jgi:hypothetical protein